MCGAILWVSKQDDSKTLRSIHSMHRWPQLQRGRAEICSRIVTSVVWNCPDMLLLTRIVRPHILWSVNKLARSITKWTDARDKRLFRLISFFHHACVTTNNIVMWETLPSNGGWDRFKTLILWTSHFTLRIFSYNYTQMRGSSRVFVVRASFVMIHPHALMFDFSTTLSLLTKYSLMILSFFLSHQLHLPGCSGHMPCVLSLMRTMAPLPRTIFSHRFWAQRPAHLRDHWIIHPGILRREQVPKLAGLGIRWLHHRHGALFTTLHPGARRCTEL